MLSALGLRALFARPTKLPRLNPANVLCALAEFNKGVERHILAEPTLPSRKLDDRLPSPALITACQIQNGQEYPPAH